MISSLDVGVLDLNSEHLGVDVKDLMEAAGRSLAEEVQSRVPRRKGVVIVCGTGNNGGDGLVAARYLSRWKVPVSVIMLRDTSRIKSEIARQAYRELPGGVAANVLRGDDIKAQMDEYLKGAGVLVDGILGSGAHGPLRGDYAAVVAAMNEFEGMKIAIDSPTGFGRENGFRADVTITFHDVKEEMTVDGRPDPGCGELVVRTIGIPDEAAVYVGPGDLLRIRSKPASAKKGETGRVLVIGGGPFIGAPSLSALAAVRTGADLVHAAVPHGIADTVSSFSTDIIVDRLMTLNPYKLGPEVSPGIDTLIRKAHAVLIGPGSGNDRSTLHTLIDALSSALSSGKPVVVDADGLTAISELWEDGKLGPDVILTPHRGELRRLVERFVPGSDTGLITDPFEGRGRSRKWRKDAMELVSGLEEVLGATLLVKGPVDLCMTGRRPSLGDHVAVDCNGGKFYRRYNTAGVPAMSVGGTGDVLAGLCAGLLSRGLTSFDAACVASYLNGTAGEEAFSQLGHSLSASEVLSRVRLLPLR